MKSLTRFLANRVPSLSVVALLLAFEGLVVQSQAANPYTLSHNNSSATLDVLGGAGMTNWLVDGQNQLAQQWFWYRVGGGGPESPIDTISSPSVSQLIPRRLDVTYSNASHSVKVGYTLTGGTAGSGTASLAETITVVNRSASVLDFHFFQYSDFDLAGVSGGQTVQFYTNALGQYYKAIQSAGAASVTETAISGPSRVEAALFNQTLLSLTDGGPTTLNDSTTAGPGNATFAYQWDVTLVPGDSFQISKTLVIVVPEPSTMALVSSGVLALAFLGRRRRAG